MPNIDSAGAKIFGTYWYALELPRHLYHFSPKSSRNVAGAVGLNPLSITTDREVFIEPSTRYILDDALQQFGVNRTPMAKAKRPGVPFPGRFARHFGWRFCPCLTAWHHWREMVRAFTLCFKREVMNHF